MIIRKINKNKKNITEDVSSSKSIRIDGNEFKTAKEVMGYLLGKDSDIFKELEKENII